MEKPTIEELEEILDGKDRHLVLNPDGSISTGEIKEETQGHSKSAAVVDVLPAMKILHLTLKKKWFDLIASGEKTKEYREIKPYWTKRLTDNGYTGIKDWDEIHFRNGYRRDSSLLRVRFLRVRTAKYKGKLMYIIDLGKVLGVQIMKEGK